MTEQDDDIVGYRRPPKGKRFQPGQSGNPKGRPKKQPSPQYDLAAELTAKVSISENGRVRRMSRQQAIFRILTAAALNQDMRAIKILLDCMRTFGGDDHADNSGTAKVDLGDLDIIAKFVERERNRGGSSPKS